MSPNSSSRVFVFNTRAELSPSTIRNLMFGRDIPGSGITDGHPTDRSIALPDSITPHIDHFAESRFLCDLSPQFLMVKGVGPFSNHVDRTRTMPGLTRGTLPRSPMLQCRRASCGKIRSGGGGRTGGMGLSLWTGASPARRGSPGASTPAVTFTGLPWSSCRWDPSAPAWLTVKTDHVQCQVCS